MKYLKFSKELYNYYNFVDEEVKKELKKRYKDKVLDITNYSKLNPLLQNKIIESVLDDNYIDNLYLVSDKHTDLILSLINNEKPNLEIDLPDNLKIKKAYNKLHISRKKTTNKKYHIIINKVTILPSGRVIEITDNCDLTNNYCTRLNSKELKLPLFVRTREDGDRMVIKNMKNHKKLKDIFIDSKLTKEERDNQPVVVDSDNNIIWLPGLKKSQFDKAKTENYDIILWYN
jgi:tRNA(Ile)-lysidine synthase